MASMEVQTEEGQRFIAKNGGTLEPEHVYLDDAISRAEFKKRPGLIALLNAANAKSLSNRPRLDAHVLRASGLRQLRGGELAAAARSLEEAYRLLPDADGLYLLSSLAHLEGRITAAKDLARRYLAETDIDPSQRPKATGSLESSRDQSRAEARRILELPDGPSGEVALLGPPGAWVVLDDRLVGRLPLARPLWVPAGAHQLAVDCGPERSVVRAGVEVASGRQLELRVRADMDSMLVTRVPAMLALLGRGTPAAAEPRLAAGEMCQRAIALDLAHRPHGYELGQA